METVDLPEHTTTEELVEVLRARIGAGADGVQLMWPLPAHIDARRAYSTIPSRVDVDGAHWVGDAELSGGLAREQRRSPSPELRRAARGPPAAGGGGASRFPWMPVTPAAVLAILRASALELRGSHILVIGRSRIVGLPLTYALSNEGSTVTLARAHGYGSGDEASSCALTLT